MNLFDGFDPIRVLGMVLALLIAVIGHEIMHGAAAYMFGDSTAKKQGRLSLNPIRHIDPLGTIVLPLLLLFSGANFLFGWAKPVPIDVRRVLERGNGAMVVVSLAGVAFNLFAAFLAANLLDMLFSADGEPNLLFFLLLYLVIWNVVLAVFNLLPVPPLDGANALAYIASGFGFYGVARVFNRIGAYGFIILALILLTDLKIPLIMAMRSLIDLMIGG
ncbi:MAG: site-2 protease family protein [Helicobacteraceae bacterium]|jgi:Zn-dependent protease|nr:site-2 protease family protein [Helicobacteraceae bacterium]